MYATMNFVYSSKAGVRRRLTKRSWTEAINHAEAVLRDSAEPGEVIEHRWQRKLLVIGLVASDGTLVDFATLRQGP